ncbi:MAG TPA: DUF3857 domain-containing protein [Terriglobales bacterium]|nr:DUF3857 domain-containing protein [Terriglobales bacterium]
MKRICGSVAMACFGLMLAVAGIAKTASAQEWQPISKEDLALKDNPASPGADAMLLYRENSVDATESAVYEYKRIKIFTEGGKKWGDVEVPFVKNRYDIKDIRARTIRPDGSIVNFDGKVYEKEVYKSGGFKVLVKAFSLPEVQPGCIIEYKYHEQHDRQYYVNVNWVIQDSLFTRMARFSMEPPKYMDNAVLYWRTFGVPKGSQPEKKMDRYVMEVHDLPGFEEEEFMFPRSMIEGRVEFYYRDIGDPQNDTPERYWKRIGKKWNDEVDHYISRRDALGSALSQIVASTDSEEVKLRKIYAYVQKLRNISYDIQKTEKEEKQENLKSNDNVEDVLKRGYGTGRQLNYLMVGLARAAGFDASEIFLAPRNETFFSPEAQDSSQLTADVVWVKLGSKDVYLDPGSRYYPYGLLPWFETGIKGLRATKQGGDFVMTTQLTPNDARRERHADISLDADGNLTGKISTDYIGESASLRREEEREEDDAGRKKDMEHVIQEWLPADASFEISQMTGWEDNEAPLHIEGKVRLAGFGTVTGRRILTPATFFKVQQAKAFEPSKRVNAIYFSYPYLEQDDITLHVPEGYRLETTPASVKTPDAVLQYSLAATAQGNGVNVHRQLTVDTIFLKAEIYGAVRNFFNLVKNTDETQLVFTSTQTAERK